ncbi:MAG: MBL fold metallo-hydrolase RNA specificity domain-containing protein [Bacillota bacterium]
MSTRIRFLGAAGEVTGSCHLLEIGGRRVLLDCGLFQGSRETEEQNRWPFAFDPVSLDAVILSHAHLDHAGRLPLLVREGYRGPIYTHSASRDLSRIMLRDAAHLAERDAETDTRKHARRGLPAVTPLYTTADVDACLPQFRGVGYGERREILPGVSFRLHDAGHILGAAVVELWIRDGRETRKLVFSGDLGHRGDFMMPPPARIEDADLVLMESTYGDRLHRSHQDSVAEFAGILKAAREQHGNVLIPAFAVGRTQEVLYLLARHAEEWGLDGWHVFLDSPMAIEATAVHTAHAGLLAPEAARYARETHFGAPHLHFVATTEESMAINVIESGAIIIAGSGMCNGGRIQHHLKHRLWRANTHVVFVGYQAEGTPGRRLVDGARELALWGEPVKVAAKIHTVGGFSAHADQQGLCDWYGAFRRRPLVALVHGENGARTSLAAELRTRFGCPVSVPVSGDTLDLADLPAPAVALDARHHA